MDFVTARELRARSAEVWNKLEAGEDIVVTRNGKPFAVLVHTEPKELEDTLRALRGARLAAGLRKSRGDARERGLESISMDEIDAEISKARAND